MSLHEKRSSTDSSPSIPWRVVAMGDYAVPTDLSVAALKKRWRMLGRLFHDTGSEADLAAHCRGNPGLAWHYWRKQLRTEPKQEQPHSWEREQSDDVVWVASGLEAPSLPAKTDEDIAFILHALLLHRSLPADLLTLLLPIPSARVMSQLLRLQALCLLIREDECWQIAPLAYYPHRA